MDRSNVMQLITKTYTEDAIAQRIPAETTPMYSVALRVCRHLNGLKRAAPGCKPP